MSDREGPTTYRPGIVRTCLGCKWLDHSMLRSGRDPIYENRCVHPSHPGPPATWVASGLPSYRGREIGRGVEPSTPDWCPVQQERFGQS